MYISLAVYLNFNLTSNTEIEGSIVWHSLSLFQAWQHGANLHFLSSTINLMLLNGLMKMGAGTQFRELAGKPILNSISRDLSFIKFFGNCTYISYIASRILPPC